VHSLHHGQLLVGTILPAGRSSSMMRIALPLAMILLLAACDERQPSHAPASSQGTPARVNPEGGSPASPQGNIPAGQAAPSQPTNGGDTQQPPRQ
jgi:hypothetical protein